MSSAPDRVARAPVRSDTQGEPWARSSAWRSPARTRELVERVVEDGSGEVRETRGDALSPGRWDDAPALITEMALADSHPGILAVPAYERMP